MERYSVIVERPAEADLRGILRYITDTLKEPATARRIYSSIRATILGLDTFPLRNRVVSDEPYAAQGVRIALAENYLVFYVADEAAHTVHVLRVLHGRREWQSIL
ncbi:MAG: type II toxin-antitoxin system RelE/ParE family toxin [Oscillospiraceae bacterium]|nr:type II toxin-antitoxin system RelE/ParE family toxin [Oscillospiraceae bacterium]